MDASPTVCPVRLDRLVNDLSTLGGAARRTVLRDRGHTDRTVKAAVAAGLVHGEGRLWLVASHADEDLRRAARARVVLTCTTAASRHGLWTVHTRELHVAARPGNRPTLPDRAVVHWARPLIPRHPDLLVDAVENVLAVVASCLPSEEALTIWESALRKGTVDPLVLARLPLSAAARALLQQASRVADSGLETIFRTRLRWLQVRIVPQAWVHGHRVDFLIGDRLVVQIDGGHHVDAQRTSDIRHDAQLMLRGYHVIRVGYAQVMHDWPGVQQLIVQAVAQGLHRAS